MTVQTTLLNFLNRSASSGRWGCFPCVKQRHPLALWLIAMSPPTFCQLSLLHTLYQTVKKIVFHDQILKGRHYSNFENIYLKLNTGTRINIPLMVWEVNLTKLALDLNYFPAVYLIYTAFQVG